MVYTPTGKPPGRPRKDAAPDTHKDDAMSDDNHETNFDEAVAEKAEALVEARMGAFKAEMAEVLAKAMADGVVAKGESPTDVRTLLSELTVAISGVSPDGASRRVIPPKEADRRKAAQERMGELLIRNRKEGRRAHYKIVKKTPLDGHVLEAWVPGENGKFIPNEVIWRGAPNTAMRPVNDDAKEVYAAFLESIGGTTKDASGAQDMPSWMGLGGLTMATSVPRSMQERGLAIEAPAPMELSDLMPVNAVISSVDDPNAELIPILGTSAEPARRSAPGKVPGLQFPER